jgi:outer membrane protein assembly factor BamB
MKETNKKARNGRRTLKILILTVSILVIGIIGFSCVKGLRTVGWSGGAVTDNTLYVGTSEGRLVAVNLADNSRHWAEKLAVSSTGGGLFGCIPAGGGCAGASGVAIYGTPSFSDELVYIAGYNGKVYAYTKDLVTRWVYPREGYLEPIVGGVVVSQDKVFFGCSDGYIYALDAATGDFLWSFSTKGEKGKTEKIWSTPVVSDGTLYIGSFDKKVYAINTADGTEKWEYLTEGIVTATPLVADDSVFVGSHDRYFYVLNASDGNLKGSYEAGNWFWAKPVLYDGKIYAGCLDGKVYVFDAATGNYLNEFNLEGPLAAEPVIFGDNVIFCTQEGTLYSINTTQDSLKQLAVLDEGDVEVNGPLAIDDGIVYIHTPDLDLHQVNAETGAILNTISLSIGE